MQHTIEPASGLVSAIRAARAVQKWCQNNAAGRTSPATDTESTHD